jgi:hypothetical protein
MDDKNVDPASELAHATAEELGRYKDVDLAVVVLVNVRQHGVPVYRVGAFVPSKTALLEVLQGAIDGLNGPSVEHIDRREYKPEEDGQ